MTLENSFSSIFDDYRAKVYPDYTLNWQRIDQFLPIEPMDYICQSYLYEMVNKRLKRRYYILTADSIISIKTVTHSRDSLDSLKATLKTYRMKLVNPRLKTIQYNKLYGVRLIVREQAQDLLCDSEEEMWRWFEQLRKVAVLEEIGKSYVLKETIGTGSSAVVRIAERVSDPSAKFAVKSIHKTLFTEKGFSLVLFFRRQ
eukprot:TRINITY_DN9722_c0_g1_i1.p2 TRINITY_DN9722_c0_g1~~TRINITY_DN9722_c0_g1_i1.p2  ORF type:complete len:200 (-),score=25.81 TRINITY_DN9722_c0_g1_i1:1299-1898(-)